MRLDREVVAVTVAIGGFDGLGAPDLKRVEQLRNISVRKCWVQVLNAQASQVFERIAIDRFGGLVRLQNMAMTVMHGHRFGYRVEQTAVAGFEGIASPQQCFDPFACSVQRNRRRFIHRQKIDRLGEARNRVLPCLFHGRLDGRRITVCIGFHDRTEDSRTPKTVMNITL
ncbi:MAG: hypothetical protein IPF83_05380 [Rhodanobacteraceae bacterium]|nr:hypothetical protein [Rhodanobacteraceae bacterium]